MLQVPPTTILFASLSSCSLSMLSFFFNDAATTDIYTLSLHDALPIFDRNRAAVVHIHNTRDRPVPTLPVGQYTAVDVGPTGVAHASRQLKSTAAGLGQRATAAVADVAGIGDVVAVGVDRGPAGRDGDGSRRE